jgi:hypothetical protein
MDLSQIITVLRVMNMTAPFDQVWCAERLNVVNTHANEYYGVAAQLRFYLVPDDSELLTHEGVFKA